MRFQVPQFIEIEDKIFGPFTFKQFIYLLGGAGGAYVLSKVLPLIIAIPLIIVVVALALALTFYKVNGRDFSEVLQSSMNYFFKSKLFIWKQSVAKKENVLPSKNIKENKGIDLPRLTEGRLKDISWSLDVLDMNNRK
ncbi:MAG: PrgI family protein [Candidatus Paceibacterota bacterium]